MTDAVITDETQLSLFTAEDFRNEYAFRLAANCAQLTHGHPTGYYAAGALAAVITHLVAGESLETAAPQAMRELAGHPGHEETTEALRRTCSAPSTATSIGS
ncbi:ADP-ribosylglycohydrolase family protein [Amycolatopsis saalfeldensis]|uniref:ADP-ribosylglycohydrolase family protein n=1 Tax=Amycolatopsis saalfeldensis TaxID=394193 RepID=UPI001FEBC154|nr:ADP-ribosylglycohydrolase family protein [Amycolatopsis saalfeldensis]